MEGLIVFGLFCVGLYFVVMDRKDRKRNGTGGSGGGTDNNKKLK